MQAFKASVSLRESHVLPRFVFGWLKESSPGFVRGITQIDQRIQDGAASANVTLVWLSDPLGESLPTAP